MKPYVLVYFKKVVHVVIADILNFQLRVVSKEVLSKFVDSIPHIPERLSDLLAACFHRFLGRLSQCFVRPLKNVKHCAALSLSQIVNVFLELNVFCLTRNLEMVTGKELMCVHSVAVSIILLALLQVNPLQLHVSPR